MHDVLAERGFRVTVARDAGAALALLGRLGRLDLLVTDIVLPGVIDGLALAHEMRQRMPAIRILLTSGYAHIQRGSSRFAGQFDFLAKPFRPSQLLDKIEALRAPGKPSQPINQC